MRSDFSMTLNRFEAEILFLNPNDVPRAIGALAAVGCEFEIDHGAIDDHGPTIFGWATGTTELSVHDLGDWLASIVEPFGGDVCEWGYAKLTRDDEIPSAAGSRLN